MTIKLTNKDYFKKEMPVTISVKRRKWYEELRGQRVRDIETEML
jgi:hypothetical protein